MLFNYTLARRKRKVAPYKRTRHYRQANHRNPNHPANHHPVIVAKTRQIKHAHQLMPLRKTDANCPGRQQIRRRFLR
jgi:hypothetical protein